MEKRKTLAEHNALITAHYDMSASEQDIFSLVLAQLKEEDGPEQLYHVSINELEELSKKQINYQHARRTTQKLQTRLCTFVKENGNLLDVTMISDAEYIKGEGYIEIGLSPKLRPYLFNLKTNFTRYQLRMFGALRSKYSKRMYKMLSQFKSTGIMRISVAELKTRLKLLDPKTGKEAFAKNWTEFVNKVLDVAKEEVNESTDLRCSYEAHKTGRKFTHLEFKIARVPMEQLKAMHGEDPTMAELRNRLVTQFRLSDWQATDIIVHVPEQEIRKTFHEITVQLSDKRIKNIGGYTAKVFNDKYSLGFFENQKNTPNNSQYKDKEAQVYSPPQSIRKQMQTALNYEDASAERPGAVSVGELIRQVAKAG